MAKLSQDDEQILMRPARVAKLLDLSRSAVYDLINRGEIPSVRIGRSVRVKISSIRDIVESRRDDAL